MIATTSIYKGYYGIKMNHARTGIILKAGDGEDEVRIVLTPNEVDKFVASLIKETRKLQEELDEV